LKRRIFIEKYSEILGVPVICINNGKNIGYIKDILFCLFEKKVLAFLIELKGCHICKKIIFIEDVINIGIDAVVISSDSSLKNIKQLKNNEKFKQTGKVIGLKVYTKKGQDLGIIKDVLFDSKTSKIDGVQVSDGLINDILKGRNIVPLFGKVEFGSENILIDKEAVEEIIDTQKGMKHFFNE